MEVTNDYVLEWTNEDLELLIIIKRQKLRDRHIALRHTLRNTKVKDETVGGKYCVCTIQSNVGNYMLSTAVCYTADKNACGRQHP